MAGLAADQVALAVDPAKLREGPRLRSRQQTAGNGALLVLVDSGGPYWERSIVEETVLVALEHFGLPYRLLDLATQRLTAELVAGCAAVVVAQNRLNEALGPADSAVLAGAVRAGVGLVNLDFDLRCLAAPLRELFGFARIGPHPYATDLIRIATSDHYITGLQDAGEVHRCQRPVTATIAEEWGPHVAPLAEGLLGRDQLVFIRHLVPGSAFEPRNFPLLFAARCGQGRAVQFAVNVRLWRRAFLGHARGLDDLLWRSIVWAARKPLVANMVPPFVTASVDDCRGRHDFAYADIASRCDLVLLASVFVDQVPPRLLPHIRAGQAGGRVRYGVHGLDYYELLTWRFGSGEYSEAELERIFARVDSWWEQVGAGPGSTLRLHWGEYGVRALPRLKQRGYRYFCPALQTGLHKADMCLEDGYWPYGLQTCYYDYLPDDPDFFAFASMLARGQEDFLTGCTAYLGESPRNDVEKAARSAAGQIRHGLRAGFAAELVTHEQKFDVVGLEEWEQILRRAQQLTAPFEQMPASHDQIGAYLESKDRLRLHAVTVAGDRLRCELAGATGVPLRLSVFVDDGEQVRRLYQEVAPPGEVAPHAGVTPVGEVSPVQAPSARVAPSGPATGAGAGPAPEPRRQLVQVEGRWRTAR